MAADRRLMPSVLRTLTCLLLLAGLATAAMATPPDRPLDLFDLEAPSFTTFTVRDGLPAPIMGGVGVDHDGFVWAASPNRLARYDGSHWETDGPFAANGVLGAFATTHDGTLWVAFRDRGIARYDGHAWQFQKGLPSDNVNRVVETTDARGHYTLWALTVDAGLLRHDGDRWAPAPKAGELPTELISMASTRTLLGGERLWVGSAARGLWYREADGDWRHFTAAHFNDYQIDDLLVTHHDGREQLWIATFGGGLWRLDASGLRAWTVESGDLASNDLYTLAQSPLPGGDYLLWAASRAGVVRVHGDTARVFDRRYGLPSNAIRDLKVWRSPDGTQVLWLATENGMARAIVGGGPWHTVSLLGASTSGVFAVLVEPDGDGGERLWVGASHDGLALFQHGRWRHFNVDDGLPAPSVRAIKRAPDRAGIDTLWIGFVGGDLARMRPGFRFESLAVPWEKTPTQGITGILGRNVDGQHELWVGTRLSGLYRWRDGVWTSIHPAGAPAHWRISELAEQTDAAGHAWLWATSSLGLIRYDGHAPTVFGAAQGLPDDELNGVTLLQDGGKPVLWIGSDHGIVRVDVSDPAHPRVLANDLPAPPDPYTYTALRDARGRIYICTNGGVQMLTPQPHGYASQAFTRRDGLPHDECNGHAQFIDSHGRYWVGMLGGLGVHDPAREQPDRTPKPLRLIDVRVNGISVDADHVKLESDRANVSVKFALLSWRNDDKSEFRTRLVGDETRPTPWTHANTRVLDHLLPGNYTLRIEARDYAGNLSTPLAVPISVLPAWWQTVAARLGFAAAISVVFYLLLHWRVRTLKARQNHLEGLVAARTEELNQANARLTELSYHDALTGLANRRRLHGALEAAARGHDPRPCSLVFLDVDHFKNYNDRYGHPAGDEALRAVAAAMTACAPHASLVARYGGEEFACLLPGIDRDAARTIAESIRENVQARAIPVPGTDIVNQVTISAGVAECVIASAADTHRLLRDADKAMYLAKREGRNCVRG